jgi:hypothetical protein
MRLAMVTFFDIGLSYGLSDDAFESHSLGPGYPAGMVGIVNPLGRGVPVDLLDTAAELIRRWCAIAHDQVERPEFEVAFDQQSGEPRDAFVGRLQATIDSRPLTRCDITLFAVGIALLRLDFRPDVPVELVRGVGRSFEYAAYTPAISDALYDTARKAAEAAMVGGARNGLVDLTVRVPPHRTVDATGYEESTLLSGSGFTTLLLAVDVGDIDLLARARRVYQIDQIEADHVVEFEYHGMLFFDWAACALQARNLDTWTGVPQPGVDRPDEAIGRMVACIEIAHTFQGACHAFVDLFRSEMRAQIGGYARAEDAGRPSQDLNRLRTLALALVSLTNLELVTPTEEDRRYFALYEEHAKISQDQRFIQEACEILYNVQEAEFQWQPGATGPSATCSRASPA